MYQLICVVGARPNFMKIAPIIEAIQSHANNIQVTLVHTGQHYDANMKHQFFDQLGIPAPDIDLEVGSGTHSEQTAEIMKRFEKALTDHPADAVLVVGDVNSTIACALVAAKNHIPVVHVEAGLRSYDRAMPEEINRVLTDQISDLLYTTERNAEANLVREGISPERIRFVGNVMIDTLKKHVEKAIPIEDTFANVEGAQALLDAPQGFALLTMHRPSNVDDPQTLQRLLSTIADISQQVPVFFPVHPRTQARINDFGLADILSQANIVTTGPLGYMELLGLMSKARVVLTDSGGIQEETTALGVPCITLRENTERPITAEQGTNTVVGTDAELIKRTAEEVLKTGGKHGREPELWDGQAAVRIAKDLSEWFARQQTN